MYQNIFGFYVKIVSIFYLKNHTKILIESLQPSFPSIVENVTVSFGRKAVLKCEVENLRNYKVSNRAGRRIFLGIVNHAKKRHNLALTLFA